MDDKKEHNAEIAGYEIQYNPRIGRYNITEEQYRIIKENLDLNQIAFDALFKKNRDLKADRDLLNEKHKVQLEENMYLEEDDKELKRKIIVMKRKLESLVYDNEKLVRENKGVNKLKTNLKCAECREKNAKQLKEKDITIRQLQSDYSQATSISGEEPYKINRPGSGRWDDRSKVAPSDPWKGKRGIKVYYQEDWD